MGNPDHHPLSGPIAAQVQRLAVRLTELDLLDLDDDPDGEIEFGFVADPAGSGEIVTAIAVGDSTYWEAGRELIEQREAGGRIRYRIGPDGPWQDAPPPPSQSASN
jgi:hypothetical protein